MPRQSDLASAAKMLQSRISMIETPGAANMTLDTLAKLASAFKVGVIVKFVPFRDMLRWENGYSQDSFDVVPRLDQDEAFLNPEEVNAGTKNDVRVSSESTLNDFGSAPVSNDFDSAPALKKRIAAQSSTEDDEQSIHSLSNDRQQVAAS